MKDYFWLNVKKAGGSSMRSALGRHYPEMQRNEPKPFIALEEKYWNDAVNNYRLPLGTYDFTRMQFVRDFLYPDERFREMFKFTLVRNPYDRAVSAWLHCTRHDPWWKTLNYILPRTSFRLFLKRLPRYWEKKRHYRKTAMHTRPVIPDITDEDGNLLVDYIARLENIQEDFSLICEKIGRSDDSFPHRNRSSRDRDYRSYYTSKSRARVEELYRADIERFDYTFD